MSIFIDQEIIGLGFISGRCLRPGYPLLSLIADAIKGYPLLSVTQKNE
jgi:hypothetical protein